MRYRESNTLLSEGQVEMVKVWLNTTHERTYWIPIKNWKMGPFEFDSELHPQLFLTISQIQLVRSWDIASPITIYPWAINEEYNIHIVGNERHVHE